jgi:hypothetical protein
MPPTISVTVGMLADAGAPLVALPVVLPPVGAELLELPELHAVAARAAAKTAASAAGRILRNICVYS